MALDLRMSSSTDYAKMYVWRPMNKGELENKLASLNIDPTAYCLSGGLPNECLVLNEGQNGTWEVYYSERGEKNSFRVFDSEGSATEFFLNVILHDSAVRRIWILAFEWISAVKGSVNKIVMFNEEHHRPASKTYDNIINW